MDGWYVAALVLLLVLMGGLTWPKVVCPRREQKTLRQFAARSGLGYPRHRAEGRTMQGRLSGTYRGRECTIEAARDPGDVRFVRMLLSVDNRTQGTAIVTGSVRASGHPSRTLSVVESRPGDLADAIMALPDLDPRVQRAIQGLRADACRILLSGYLLRLEYTPHGHCLFGPLDDVDHLGALLDVLCDIAEAIERYESVT
jgi:hypothetical protein